MDERPSLLDAQYRRVSFAIYSTIALIAFEGTSVAAALPELAADLGHVDLLPWVITGYLFASGVTTVFAGPLVDAVGARRVFTTSAAVFAVSGFSAGLVNTTAVLIAVRLVQGGASGVLLASAIAAVNLAYPSRLTGRAFAANSTIWGITGAAAPAIAAVMLSVASWRWIFFVNLPLGVLALYAGRNTLPGPQSDAEPMSIDRLGVVLTAAFTLTTILALDALGFQSVALLLLAGGIFAVYVRHARKISHPILRLDHILEQPFLSVGLVPALIGGAAFTTNLYITIYVSAGRGVSNGAAAWSVLYFTLGWTLGANIASVLLDRRTPSIVMLYGLCVATTGSIISAVAALTTTHLAFMFTGLALMGIGIGLAANASLTLLRDAARPSEIGRASAAQQFVRGQGYTLGAAAGGAILLFVVGRDLGSTEPVRRLLAGEDVGGPEIANAVQSGFVVVTITSVATLLVAFIPMIALLRHDASQRHAGRN